MSFPTLRDSAWSPVFYAYGPAIRNVAARMQALLEGGAMLRYSDGKTLSDRIWRWSGLTHGRIQSYIRTATTTGESAWDLSRRLERHVRAGAECLRWTSTRLRLTKQEVAQGDRRGLISGPSPCATGGVAYAALRLARNEIQIAHHMATDEIFAAMPWVQREYIRLSPDHPDIECECPEIASGGPWADRYPGLYPKGEVILPVHIQCLCHKEASLMHPKTFAGRVRAWMTGEKSWDAMDHYMVWLSLADNGPISVAAFDPAAAQRPTARTAEEVREAIVKLSLRADIERRRPESERDYKLNVYRNLRDAVARERYRIPSEEYFRRQDEVTAAWHEYDALEQQLRAFVQQEKGRERDLLSVGQDGLNPAQFKVKYRGRWAKERKAGVQEGLDAFARLVGTGTVEGKQVEIVKGGAGRSYYQPGVSEVHIATGEGARATIHEMGHWFEEMDADVHDSAIAFLEERTQGEAAAWLGDLYGRSEVAKRDKFISPYMGKIYLDQDGKQYATEIVSMGVEAMWKNPADFALVDPGYFDFVFNLVRGWPAA